jgi:hypothetical protein
MLHKIALCIAAAAFILGSFYIGMSRELCRRDLSTAEYQSMKLDCDFWLYR